MKVYAQGKYPNFFNGGEFEVLAMQNGYKAANSGRRAREMFAAGILERRIATGGSVEYRWNPHSSPPEERENDYDSPIKIIHRYLQRVPDAEVVRRITAMNPRKEIKVEVQKLF